MTNKIRFLLTILLISLLTLSCDKSLISTGESSFNSDPKYVNENSVLKIYSYKNSSPDYVADLSTSINTISIPTSITNPSFSFGEPVNPLLYVFRNNPTKAVPIDLFVKVYNRDQVAPDHYYEAPVLGSSVTPSNTTTALSWILRWGFNNQTLSLSENQFNSIIAAIEVNCFKCRQLTNTETVEFILNSNDLVQIVLNEVNKSNTDFSFTSVQYFPPSLDYVWSNPAIISNWEIVNSFEEPVSDDTTLDNLLTTTSMNVDVVMVSPLASQNIIKPDSWIHTAKISETQLLTTDLISTFSDVVGTPLIYTFNFASSGVHTFASKFSDYSSSLQVVTTVLNKNVLPTCSTNSESEPFVTTANRLFSYSLNLTTKPLAYASDGLTVNGMLRISKVSFTDFSIFPNDGTQTNYYKVVFNTSGTNIYYSTYKYIYSTTETLLSSGTLFNSGDQIIIDNNKLSFFMTGTPNSGDFIKINLPTDENNNIYKGLNKKVYGCFDPDPSTDSNIIFSKVSGPAGLTVTSTGLIQWGASTSDYTYYYNLMSDADKAANKPPIAPVVINVTDSYGVTKQKTYYFKIYPDNIPFISVYNALTASDQVLNTTTTSLTNRLPLDVSRNFYELFPVTEKFDDQINNFTIHDIDGDAIKLKISRLSETGTFTDLDSTTGPIITLSDNTTFDDFNLIASGTTGSDASWASYQWNFIPDSNQLTKGQIYGYLPIQLDVYYTDSSEFQTVEPAASAKVYLKINNVIDNPSLGISIGNARCFDSSTGYYFCNDQSDSDKYVTTLVVSETATTTQSGDSSLDSAITSTTKQLYTGSASGVVSGPIAVEGQYATLILPVSFTITRDAGVPTPYNNIYPLMYTLVPINSSNSNNCTSILNGGRFKIEEGFCYNSSTSKCLTVKLNYDTLTNTQKPLPYFLPSSCEFSLFARESNAISSMYPNPKTQSSMINYKLFIKDVNRPTSLVDYTYNITPIASAPTEGSSYDFSDSYYGMISDPDLGIYNGLNIQNYLKNSSILYTKTDWGDEIKVTSYNSSLNVISGTTGSTYLTGADGVKAEAANQLRLNVNYTNFIGKVIFYQCKNCDTTSETVVSTSTIYDTGSTPLTSSTAYNLAMTSASSTAYKLRIIATSGNNPNGSFNYFTSNNISTMNNLSFDGSVTSHTVFTFNYNTNFYSAGDNRNIAQLFTTRPILGSTNSLTNGGVYYLPANGKTLKFNLSQSGNYNIDYTYSTDSREKLVVTCTVSSNPCSSFKGRDGENLYPDYSISNLFLFNPATIAKSWKPSYDASTATTLNVAASSSPFTLTITDKASSTATRAYTIPVVQKPGPYYVTISSSATNTVLDEDLTNTVDKTSKYSLTINPSSSYSFDNYPFYLDNKCTYTEANYKSSDTICPSTASSYSSFYIRPTACNSIGNSCTGTITNLSFTIDPLKGWGKLSDMTYDDSNSTRRNAAVNLAAVTNYKFTSQIKTASTTMLVDPNTISSATIQVRINNKDNPDANITFSAIGSKSNPGTGIENCSASSCITGTPFMISLSNLSASTQYVLIPFSIIDPDTNALGAYTDDYDPSKIFLSVTSTKGYGTLYSTTFTNSTKTSGNVRIYYVKYMVKDPTKKVVCPTGGAAADTVTIKLNSPISKTITQTVKCQ